MLSIFLLCICILGVATGVFAELEEEGASDENGSNSSNVAINVLTSSGGSATIQYSDVKEEIPEGSTYTNEIQQGTEVSITMCPSEGYTLENIYFNGEAVPLEKEDFYSFNLEEGSTIELDFQKISKENNSTKREWNFRQKPTPDVSSATFDARATATSHYVQETTATGIGVTAGPNFGDISGLFDQGLMYVDGQPVFCIDPYTSFEPGNVVLNDAVGYTNNYGNTYSQADITKLALLLKGADVYIDNHLNLSVGVKYAVKQILIWRTLNDSNMLQYNDADFYLLGVISKASQSAIFEAANQYYNSHKSEYKGVGTVYVNGDTQDTVHLEEEPIVGYLKLKKSSSNPTLSNNNGCYSLAGGEWGVFSDSACTNKVGTLTSDENGNTNTLELPIGTYYVKELVPPKGFALYEEGGSAPVETVQVESGETVTVTSTDDPKNDPFDILLYKLDEGSGQTPQGNASLAGAQFQLDYYDALLTKDQIKSGAFQPKDSYIFQTIDQNGVPVVRVDIPECYVSSPTGSELYKVGGIVTFPVGTLTVREIKAPEGYKIEGSVIEDEGTSITDNLVVRQITDSGMSSPIHVYNPHNNSNKVIRGGFKIDKRDMETGLSLAKGDASLDGTEFALINRSDNFVTVEGRTHNPGDTIATFTTDGSGKWETANDYLPYGTYEIVEIVAPTGFLAEGVTSRTFSITTDGEIVDMCSADKAILNKPIRGGFKIEKRDFETGKDEAREDTTFTGTELELINRSRTIVTLDGVDYNPGDVMTSYTLKEDNLWEVPADYLSYGTYEIREKTAPTGFLQEGTLTRTFSIRTNGEIIDMRSSDKAILNKPIRGDLELLKLAGQEDGSEEDHREGLEGAEFTISSKRTGEVQAVITTDEHGIATTKGLGDPRGTLIYGTYIIEETFTPEGFKPIKPFEVKIREEGVTVRFIYLEDKLIMAPLQVVKVDSSTGRVIPIAGTRFQILDSNGEVVVMHSYYPSHVEYSEFETSEDGSFQLPEKLRYGTYYLEELQAPEGYLKGERLEFKIEEGRDWDNPIVVKYEDDNAKGKVRLHKTDESTGEPLSGAKFVVTAEEDIITPDGTLRENKGDIVETLVTSAEGYAESGELFIGKYSLTEVETPDGYALDDTKRPFEITYQDQETPLMYVDFDLSNKPTEFHLIKKDIDDQPLKGIVFELTSNGKSKELTTDEEGLIDIKYIKRGSYTLKEKETLPGYVLDTTSKYFKVDENGYIFETTSEGVKLEGQKDKANSLTLTWVNGYTKVDISKSDITGEEEIPGATIQIIQDGEVIEEWVSSDKPHHIDKLPVGDYVLHEEITPNGYVTANDVEFTVDSTGELQKVHMVDKQVFVSKTDITGENEVEGAHLKVVDKDGNTIDEWDSAKEKHPVNGLQAGKTYTLIEERAPEGFVIAEEIEFTVDDDGKVQHVEMHDKQVFINKSNVIDVDEVLDKPVVPEEKEEEDEKGEESEEDKETGEGEETEKQPGEKKEDKEKTVNKDSEYVKFLTKIEKEIVDEIVDAILPEDTEMEEDSPNLRTDKFSTDEVLEGREFLKGVKLQVQDLGGNVIDEWETTGDTYAVSNLVIGETYNLVEIDSVEGYVKSVPYQFTVEKDNENMFVLMKDKQVVIYKEDIAGKELPGAEITITDEEGNIVDEWVSEEAPHPITGLEEGKTYTFKEESAPDGYLKVEEFDFTVDESLTNLHIFVTDNHTRVSISKQDATTGKELPGAKLTLFDWNNKEIETWTSTTEPHLIERLVPGTYTLHEDLAPIGYNTASDVTFEVKPTGEVQKVVMKDEVKPKVKKLVQTGETILLAISIMLILTFIGLWLIKMKRRV